MGSWFLSYLPSMKEVKPLIEKTFTDMKNIDGLEDIYLWGSCLENFEKDIFRPKDVDILFKTVFHSGDLLSLTVDNIKTSSSDSLLEEQGFNPKAVSFSKIINNFDTFNMDPWAISLDKKILHWGPLMYEKKDTLFLRKQAEEHACLDIGVRLSNLQKASDEIREEWFKKYEYYLDKYFEDMPYGWYQIKNAKIEDILEKVKKID